MLSINRPLLINSKFDSDVATAEPTIDTLETFCRDTIASIQLLLLHRSTQEYSVTLIQSCALKVYVVRIRLQSPFTDAALRLLKSEDARGANTNLTSSAYLPGCCKSVTDSTLSPTMASLRYTEYVLK